MREAEDMCVPAYGDVMSSRQKSRASMPAKVSVPFCAVREEWRRRRTSPRSVRYGASPTIHHQLPRPDT